MEILAITHDIVIDLNNNMKNDLIVLLYLRHHVKHLTMSSEILGA